MRSSISADPNPGLRWLGNISWLLWRLFFRPAPCACCILSPGHSFSRSDTFVIYAFADGEVSPQASWRTRTCANENGPVPGPGLRLAVGLSAGRDRWPRLLRSAGLSLGMLISLSGCSLNVKPCPQPDVARVAVSFDWCEVAVPPGGIRVVFFPVDGLSQPSEFSMYAEGDEITLPCNIYSVVVYNVDVETVRFTSGSYAGAEVRLLDASRPGAEPEGAAVGEPEMLYVCAVEHFEAAAGSDALKLKFKPRCVVRECAFSIPLKGAEFVKDLRGSVTGMAPAINLSTGEPVGTGCTIYFSHLVKTADGVQGRFRYFGCCDPTRAMGMQSLVIELLRPDGVQKVAFDVSETLMAAQPGPSADAPPLVIEQPIEVDYVPGPDDPDNDFDVSVGDWDDEIFVPVPM